MSYSRIQNLASCRRCATPAVSFQLRFPPPHQQLRDYDDRLLPDFFGGPGWIRTTDVSNVTDLQSAALDQLGIPTHIPKWCAGRDSNPHQPFGQQGSQPCASANFATGTYPSLHPGWTRTIVPHGLECPCLLDDATQKRLVRPKGLEPSSDRLKVCCDTNFTTDAY